MSLESRHYDEYLDALEALKHESQLIREEIVRTISFEHLHQRIKAIQQQVELIHDTLEPRTFAEKAHVEHLHHTALSLISHHLNAEGHTLERLKENDEFWEQIEKLQESILDEIEQLKVATELEAELTESLSELNEQTEEMLEAVEEHQDAHAHIDTHQHIQHIKHRLHQLHHPHEHTKHDSTHAFLEHYHDTIEEIALHMHHLQHRFTEIFIELKEEQEKLEELKELQQEIIALEAAYQEQLEATRKEKEHQHMTLHPGPHIHTKKDAS